MEEIEIVVPYGNPNSANHIRARKAVTTLCGRNSYGWSVTGAALKDVIESGFTCRRCAAAIADTKGEQP
jgi:hypothetical protein